MMRTDAENLQKKAAVAFRLDAGAAIGAGHAMRCLSLADALRARGADCVFVLANDGAQAMVQARGYAVQILGTAWDDWDAELPALLPLLERLRPAWVVADGYPVTPRWLSAVRARAKTAYFDDLRSFLYDADVVINYNLYALDWAGAYRAQYEGTGTRLLLGPQYAPLRAEFAGLPPRPAAERLRTVLVSTGGANPQNVAGGLLNELAAQGGAWADVEFLFVVGALNPRLAALARQAAALPNARVLSGVTDMAALMCRCDAAVAAAGSTLYELCACGVPTVTYILADNQRDGAAAFAARGIMRSAGDCRADPAAFARRVFAELAALRPAAPRAALSARAREAVDARGAERLAEHLAAEKPENREERRENREE